MNISRIQELNKQLNTLLVSQDAGKPAWNKAVVTVIRSIGLEVPPLPTGNLQIVIDPKITPQLYVFANADRSEIVVTDIAEIVADGIPIDPDNGDDLEYLGIAAPDLDYIGKPDIKTETGSYTLWEHFTDPSNVLINKGE